MLSGENTRTKQKKESHDKRSECERAEPWSERCGAVRCGGRGLEVYSNATLAANELSSGQRGGPVQRLSIFNHIRKILPVHFHLRDDTYTSTLTRKVIQRQKRSSQNVFERNPH